MPKSRLACIAIVLGAWSVNALAADANVTLRFAHWVPATHPLHSGGWGPWANSIEAASGGTIRLQFFPAGQLGKPADHYDMARDGIADFGWLNPGFNPGRWVIASAGTIPLLIKEAKDSSAAFTEWYRRYSDKEMGDVKMCMLHSMQPGTVMSRKPIRVPSDFRGMKYRASNTMEALFVRNHGGTLVNAPQPEIRDILARGVADATFNNWHSAISFGISKEITHVLDLSWGSPVYALVLNKGKYGAMSERQRKVIDEHCSPEWSKKFISAAADWEWEGRQLLIKAGKVLYKPNAPEMKAWRDGLVPVRQQWEKEVKEKGFDAKAIFSDLEQTLRKYNALNE